eukprot:3700137-Pyramimonas_sp.AAC.1
MGQGRSCLDIVWRQSVRAHRTSGVGESRYLLFDGAHSEGITPTLGIVAGSTSATYEAKAFMLPSVQRSTGVPDTGLGLHIDDL